jgi:type I restriction enzyme M protein
MLISADPKTGRVAVVLPQGALFRKGAEARIRAYVTKADKIEAVIGLAPNLFYGTGLAACVLILRHDKPAHRKGQVLFINGEDLMKKGRNQNTLEPEHASRLFEAYARFADIDGRARVATVAEIEGNDFNLNIPLYVVRSDNGEKLTLTDALANLDAAHAKTRVTRAALEAELAKWGLSA